MSNTKRPVKNFINSKKNLFNYFNCDEDFFIKPLLEHNWLIKEDGDYSFLSYWLPDEKRFDAVIVKKSGEAMIYKTEEYTMIIAIDCVKIGFIFSNKNCAS